MADLIDRQAFIEGQCNSCDGWCEDVNCDCLNCKSDHRCDFIKDLADEPSVDAVSRGLFEQIKWERDIAMEQLEEHGIAFGAKAECAVVAVEVGNCEGCIYSHRKRPQKCSCCRRNRDLKDCYERREENDHP